MRRRTTALVAALGMAVVGSPVLMSPSAASAAEADDESTLRIGVLALTGAISAVGQTPELATPLPFTTTSLADVLGLDASLTASFDDVLQGTDLEVALEAVEGITLVNDGDPDTIAFTYSRTETVDLALVHDDGDLRFGPNDGAGEITVSLVTRASDPFVVEVDESQPDPLLRVALVSQPVMDLDVDIANADLDGFDARQGFTEVRVDGGRYELHRSQQITMRDPDGRGVLTLEDLRYSTLPDLFRVETDEDEVDVRFDVRLPASIDGGSTAERAGTLAIDDDDTWANPVWPTATDATRTYGGKLAQATGLSMVDGITALAQYTGTVLALQDAADVPFPHLGGGTSDLFAPGDKLLELLSTAAAAQVVCGLSPENPPVGVAAPGDTVYCQATTAQGLGALSNVEWTLRDGGSLASSPTNAIGQSPEGLVKITGSDGEPDLQVSFTAKGQSFTARSMPHTVQEVMDRIEEIAGSEASAALTADRLDVAVDISQASVSKQLTLGNPGTLGALVGLTGLGSGDEAKATATGTGATFDVGFGVETGEPAQGAGRETYLLPADSSLLSIDGLSATAPAGVTGMSARIGFLEVAADLTGLSLGKAGSGAAVSLDRASGGSTPLRISDLLTDDGALDPDQLDLQSQMTAGIAFTAREQAMPGDAFATGIGGGASGSASVAWNASGLPAVTFGTGYAPLRVFDPVPATFLSGVARISGGSVFLDLPDGTSLYDEFNVADVAGTEVARRLMTDVGSCQNVTVVDADTLTCGELAPADVVDGQAVSAIVLGDPFALRDSVIEGLATALAEFDRLTGDNRDEGLAFDQYASTLPLVDLTPSQLATEREALRQGLAAIDAAATADEQGTSATPVSSAQELAASIDDLVKVGTDTGFAPSLAFDLGTTLLGVRLTASDQDELDAPLRFDDSAVGGRGQVTSNGGTVEVATDSTTTLGITVDRDTARPALAETTGTESTATLDRAGFSGHRLLAGISELQTQGDSSAHLGVQVATDFVDGHLETTRSNTRGTDPAAEATLHVGDGDTIEYVGLATDSSGGEGATQPAPDRMQVKFLAEGLDGLAAALESAMDGAAPRNLGPDGAPISAPLIGTNLGADAGIPDLLTDLTSELRDELEDLEDVTEADALEGDLEDAVAAAAGGGISADDVEATVSCDGGACAPCDADDEDDEDCDSDGPTVWETVDIAMTLSGEADGETPFETGLAGLEVRSIDPVTTETDWELPVTLRLKRGVGPQVLIGSGDALTLDVTATMPDSIDAIVGYLPATLTPSNDAAGTVETTIEIAPAEGEYDLFDLYEGSLTATPSFSGDDEEGISLDFETITENADGESLGTFGLSGNIDIPWTAADGFDEVTYNDVKLDVGTVAATVATPFAVVDPYLAPVRDVIDVLRTPIPVISTLSELAGGDEVTLLYLLETLSAATEKPQLELAHRVINLVGGVTDVISAIAPLAQQNVDLEDLSGLGELVTLDPSEVSLYEKCTETVSTSTTVNGTATTKKTAPQPCPDGEELADDQAKDGAAGQTTNEQRKGTRKVKEKVAQTTREITGSLPGFSLPFLSDPDQLVDVLMGEGEASYFRIDLGTLAAQVAYSAKFGPIMAGPVPIVPFVGGSISVEGRLAMGFDSYAQTLAAHAVNPGDARGLVEYYSENFDLGDVIREGFYVDDLDADGVDVPEVQLVTTLEAGAGVSIGIVTAGLKGGVTLTINLDLNDPDDDGKLRTAEIRTVFAGNAKCIFDASAEIEAFISVFVEIELLLTSLEYEFDILRLGPYTLFEYGCPDVTPSLVVRSGNDLVLTSGEHAGDRLPGSGSDFEIDGADDFEVRQFDQPDDVTRYEVSGLGRVQVVEVKRNAADSYAVKIFESGLSVSGEEAASFTATAEPTFRADGGELKDQISFLAGEEFTEDGEGELALSTSAFTTQVTKLTGGPDDDTLVTGDADDRGIDGEEGNDSIDTGLGDDVATGGHDNDVVGGGAGRDDLSGGEGNDRLEGGPGGDRVNGEAGDDSLVGGPGRDVRALLVRPRDSEPNVVSEQVRLGFDSGDVLVGGLGADTVDGGDGSDVVVGGVATSLTTAALGTLFEEGARVVNVLTEGDTEEDDNTFGEETVPVDTAATSSPSELDDLCVSGDEETGAGSTDFVTGGPEADVVIGGNGADTLDGGAGPDEICGRAGDDQISGDGAEDEDDSDDVIRGGTGDDRADGGPGDDVVHGDDVDLFRGGTRHLDGSLGGTGDGAGRDYLDGGEGSDVIAGGAGSDLVIGGLGDDATYGEGKDTTATGGAAPGVDQRLLACNPATRVVRGLVDLDGDLFAGAGDSDTGITADTGQLVGLAVVDGVIRAPGTSNAFEGLLGSETVVLGGRIDLDRDGDVSNDAGDTGWVALPSMLGTGSNADGDCILAGDGNDELGGGTGSDYLGAGEGTDLADGGDGNDLLLGDGGTDVLLGGPHHDVLVGGIGDDHLQGEDGDDRLRGNEGADDLIGGSDSSGATDGQDVLLGGREEDVLVAENGAAVSASIVSAVTDPAVPWTGAAPESTTSEEGDSLVFGDSALLCDDAPADRWLTLLVGDGTEGDPAPSPGTSDLAYDELYGGYDCDFVFGSTGADLVRGGQDDDVVEGGPGGDFGYGDDGDDVVIGGSSYDPGQDTRYTLLRSGAGVADGADVLRGDGGPDAIDGDDLVVGDNALPTRLLEDVPGPDYVVQLHDVATTSVTPAASASGGDTLGGDGGDDRLIGQGGPDTIAGGEGDDYAEGNDGADSINGGLGADDVIGGSSATDGRPLGGTGHRLTTALAGPLDASAAGLRDTGYDVLQGDAGADVVLGDNGRITRPEPGSVRHIARADEVETATVSDADSISGGADSDRLFGQGGNDTVDGGSEDDHVEGNEGNDGLTGGAGGDVVIGGSSLSPDGRGTLGDAVSRARTQLDGIDTIRGDLAAAGVVGSDLLLGDNATVLRHDSGRWIVQLADVATTTTAAAPGTFGDDTIIGGAPATGGLGAPDRVFGQGGDDTVTTGPAGDYVEGNGGADAVSAGDGVDDVIGGSSATKGRPLGDDGLRLLTRMSKRLDSSAAMVLDGLDTVYAGSGDDTVLGDNGRITRPADGQRPMPDVAMADTGADTGADTTYGSDKLFGEDGDDVLYGQLDDGSGLGTGDELTGGAGHDTLLGDLAVVTKTPFTSKVFALNSDAINETVVAPDGSTMPVVYVPTNQATNGGPDIAWGNEGNDTLHLGGGNDLANAGSGTDAAFGGSGDDAVWGGIGHDRIFGGYGADDLDLKFRSGDPAAYARARDSVDSDGTETTHNGDDIIYGGWGPDELQADVGGSGKQPVTDHLIDWVGAHNVYYVCGGAYGAGRIIRQGGPGMQELLTGMALALGAAEPTGTGSGGWYDLGMVYSGDKNQNNDRSPEHPGHFTCG